MKDDNPVSRLLLPPARLMALLAGYLLLGLSFLVTAEVVLRSAFNLSLQGSDEFGGYTLAVLAAFGFSYALLERAHTRVEILIERVGTGPQALLNLVSCWCIALMALFMAWRSYAALMESVEYGSLSGTPLMTPLWQPQLAWFIGLLFFAAVASIIAIHALILMVSDRRRLNRFYGMKTLEEIIDEERVELHDDPGAFRG
ncbi:TRAP transporter small permease subunit [Ancylobacter sp. G4_0304]|uniref:TRAP transporter small permease subunit n=1 Tax=Ancylobacter sp. G4_0304 TaxID=3114289 RepID=UPI0039C712FF